MLRVKRGFVNRNHAKIHDDYNAKAKVEFYYLGGGLGALGGSGDIPWGGGGGGVLGGGIFCGCKKGERGKGVSDSSGMFL